MSTVEQLLASTGKRIVLCTADVGCGHGRASNAINSALRQHFPGNRVRTIDALTTTPKWFNRIYRDLYLACAKGMPRLNGWMYDMTDRVTKPGDSDPASVIEAFALRKFAEIDEIRAADLLVCTHFLCARVLSKLKGQGKIDAPLAVVVTDQHPHAVWRVSNADLFLIASESAAEELVRCGIERSRIRVTGIPIDSRFDSPISRDSARREHGVPPDAKLILITGGGLGLGGIDLAAEGVLSVPGDARLIIVCGRNEPLRAQLAARFKDISDRCTVLGLTSRMHDLMTAADVMVGKPGGLTTAEATALGLPMVLLRPLPGQEERNARALTDAGAAKLHEDPREAGVAAAHLVNQPEELARIRAGARAFGKSGSARAAARALIDLLAQTTRPTTDRLINSIAI